MAGRTSVEKPLSKFSQPGPASERMQMRLKVKVRVRTKIQGMTDPHLSKVAVVKLEPVLCPAGATLREDALRQLLRRVLSALHLACASGSSRCELVMLGSEQQRPDVLHWRDASTFPQSATSHGSHSLDVLSAQFEIDGIHLLHI